MPKINMDCYYQKSPKYRVSRIRYLPNIIPKIIYEALEIDTFCPENEISRAFFARSRSPGSFNLCFSFGRATLTASTLSSVFRVCGTIDS